MARALSINLISAEEAMRAIRGGDRIFVLDIRERKRGEEFGVGESV